MMIKLLRHRVVLAASSALFALLTGSGAANAEDPNYVFTSISSGFNGTDIAAGNYIWFNANFKYSTGPTDVEVLFAVENSRIQFTADNVDYDLAVPDSRIRFIPGLPSATIEFNEGLNTWIIEVPADFGDDVFLTGLAWPVPVDLPGGIGPVLWTADIGCDTAPTGIKWKWGAAVYTNFSEDYDLLDVKPVHETLHAGTPQAFQDFVIGGARGGGGSNFTGSWSGTESVGFGLIVSVEDRSWGGVKALYR